MLDSLVLNRENQELKDEIRHLKEQLDQVMHTSKAIQVKNKMNGNEIFQTYHSLGSQSSIDSHERNHPRLNAGLRSYKDAFSYNHC